MPLRRSELVGPVLAGVAAAVATVVGHGVVLGLLDSSLLRWGPPVGAGDNGDGFRLFCTVGLRPDTPESNAAWRGVVVTDFTTGHPPCGPITSSAGVLLRVATTGAGPIWSSTTLAWLYVALTALGVAVAVAALAGDGLRRAVLVALPLLPLVVVPWWSRFDVSTYAEPAGLLGTVWVLLGAIVVAGTAATRRGARSAALALLAVGGLVAATAKPGFVPVGIVAALACTAVAVGDRPRRAHGPGLLAAVLLVILAAGPVTTAVREQGRVYGKVNTHNLVFTALLPEAGPGVLDRLGLPPGAARAAGESWYWAGARDVPGWEAAIGADPAAARARAHRALLADPVVAARLVGRGLTATLRPQLAYLPSAPRGTAPERNEVRTIYPETAPIGDVGRAWVAGIALPGAPAALVALAGAVGAATLRPSRRRHPRSTAAGLARTSTLAASAALGVVALAVLGDGYYELTKHVWLASYLLAVTGLLLLAAGGAWVHDRPRPTGLIRPAGGTVSSPGTCANPRSEGVVADSGRMTWVPDPDALRGRTALVAGATRGAGRGIAAALGEAGATVVCTGRSSARGDGTIRSDYAGRHETIEQTAALVTELGGVGIAEQVDHLDPAQVERLAERLGRDHGHLDVLVDDIWGAEELKGPPPTWNTPVWRHDLATGLRILRLAVDTHLITSHHLLPLLIARRGGLLVEVTDGTAAFNADHYRISVYYDLAKVAINRLAFSQGHELAAHGATAVAVTPGWLRSEMMLENVAVTESTWRDALDPHAGTGAPTAPPGFASSESPRYVGRAVAALAADPARARWNQHSVTSADLARTYGFTDVDGARPDSWADVH